MIIFFGHYSSLSNVYDSGEYLALYVVYGNAEVMVVLVMYHSSIEVDGQRFLDVIHQNKGKHPSNYLDYEHHGDHHTKLLHRKKHNIIEIIETDVCPTHQLCVEWPITISNHLITP